MARKKPGMTKPKEAMFLGNSRELKSYLLQKKKSLKQMIKSKSSGLSKEQSDKVLGYIDSIDEMLEQKYFKGRNVYTMTELIEEIKIERADLKTEIEVLKQEVNLARCAAEKAFKGQKSYLANKYEEEFYNQEGQIELRRLIDEYQALEYQFESLEKCRKTLWLLLGVIHRPVGYFEKVIE